MQLRHTDHMSNTNRIHTRKCRDWFKSHAKINNLCQDSCKTPHLATRQESLQSYPFPACFSRRPYFRRISCDTSARHTPLSPHHFTPSHPSSPCMCYYTITFHFCITQRNCVQTGTQLFKVDWYIFTTPELSPIYMHIFKGIKYPCVDYTIP